MDSLKKYLQLIKLLAKGQTKKFVVELKLWGPKFYKDYIDRKYCKGFIEKSPDEIRDEKLKKAYSHFCKNDFSIIKNQLDLVDFIDKSLKGSVEKDEFGRTKTRIKDLALKDLVQNTDPLVHELLKLIYGRHFWIREDAFIMEHTANMAGNHIQASWHVDGYNQITLQLLLEDSDKDAVATEIVPGSSKFEWDFNRANNQNAVIDSSFKFTGEKGDLFIFYGGGSLHRSYIGSSDRKALFINLSSGWYEAGLL
ncbi:MAG: hypothetical protein CBE49_000335 [Rickettsiales bacterium TMED289]|nr:MAG: hypothetical protein CBE49_000335 [Rickettsiales bacterium TMED289]